MKVLFIAEIASPHSGRWINLATARSVESVVFQATCAPTALCNELRTYKGTLYSPRPIEGVWSHRSMLNGSAELDALVAREGIYPDKYVDFLLATIADFQPDLIHVLGLCVNFHNSSRILLSASKKRTRAFPPIVYSSWGADLDYYAKEVPTERPYIADFLKICDFHITECKRDVRLARELGFSGTTLATLPANGGVEALSRCETRRLQKIDRDVILIKGRDEMDGDPIGRATKVLEALELAQSHLKPFRIKIFQASHGLNVQRRAAEIKSKYGLDIEVLPFLTEADLYKLIRRSYLFIANTINDGLPLSLVEAMAFGAYPIHSDLESIREYIQSGKNGTLFEWSDVDALARAIEDAIDCPTKVAHARQLNFDMVESKLSRRVVGRRIVWSYFRVAGFKAEILRQISLLSTQLSHCRRSAGERGYQLARNIFRSLPEGPRKSFKEIIFKIYRRP